MIFVKQKAFPRVIRPVHPVGIFKIVYVKPKHNHGIYLSNLISLRKFQHCIGLFLHTLKQKQLTGSSPIRIHRKIHPAGNGRSAIDFIHSRAYFKAIDHIHGLHMNFTDRRNKSVIFHLSFPPVALFSYFIKKPPPLPLIFEQKEAAIIPDRNSGYSRRK